MSLTRTQKIEQVLLLEELERRRQVKAQHDDLARTKANLDAVRESCKSLLGFIREFWIVLEPRAPFVEGRVIEAICQHLEAVHYGQIQNLLITVPPGMMKSLLVSVFFQAWEWGPMGRPDLRYLATSYSDDNISRDADKVRKLIESPKYQALYGETVKRARKWGTYLFENEAGGNRDSRPFGSLTGGRGDRNLIDDPHSTTSADSETQRLETVKQFREGATDRLNDLRTSATIIIMQRLHTKDVAGVALELDSTIVHLNLPMEFEPARACETRIGFQDWRTEPGELLFPERFPAAEVARLKKMKGAYAWAGQYQQRPAPREGGLFKRADFQTTYALPPKVRSVRAWDLAATIPKPGKDPDWTVGIKVSVDPEGRFFVERPERVQASGAGVKRLVKATAAADGTETVVRLPQDPGQAGKAQALEYVTMLAGYRVSVVQPTGSKVVRAGPASTQVENHNIYLVITGDPDKDAWVETFLDEHEVFPAGTHDDQVDAFADAINELAVPTMKSAAIFALAQQELAEMRQAQVIEPPPDPGPQPGSMEYMQALAG